MSAERRLQSLGIKLPPVGAPAGHYAPAARSGDLLFLSGKATPSVGGAAPTGRLGREYTVVGVVSLRKGLPLTLKATIKISRA